MREITYFRLPHAKQLFAGQDVRELIINCKELKISADEFLERLLPIDFATNIGALKKFNTIIAKAENGEVLEFVLNKNSKKGYSFARDFFQSGTRVAVITVIPGTERKRRTVKRTIGSPEYRKFLSERR